MNTPDPASLQNLHDIVAPQPVPWLPPAPGWYALGFAILLLSVWFTIHNYLLWRQNAYRREALAELAAIDKNMKESEGYRQLLPQLPQLVKRTAIAAYGRRLVASLSGEEWLAFLDTTGSTRLFSKGSGRLLSHCSYQSAAQLTTISREQLTELLRAVSHWIRNHKPFNQV